MRIVVTAVAIYLSVVSSGILVCWYMFPWDSVSGYKDFRDASGIFAACITIISSALTSIYTMHRNLQGAQALEQIKAELQERLKNLEKQNAIHLETLKATSLSRRIEAYKILLGSAQNCFDDLATMESGGWRPEVGLEHKKEMRIAARELMFLDIKHAEAWLKFRSRAHFLVERCLCATAASEQIEVWKHRGREFGEMLNTFEEVARQNVPSV